MKKIAPTIILLLLLWPLASRAYRIEEDQFYIGSGFGVNINVARFDKEPRKTSGFQLPLIANLDYAIDRNIGVFGCFSPLFGAGSMALSFKGGAKYWFSFLDAPYVPYISLALTNTFFIPMGEQPIHFNLGLSPGVGVSYFVLAKFMVGAHVHFNPSIAFADGEKKFEFSVLSFFDVTIKI